MVRIDEERQCCGVCIFAIFSIISIVFGAVAIVYKVNDDIPHQIKIISCNITLNTLFNNSIQVNLTEVWSDNIQQNCIWLCDNINITCPTNLNNCVNRNSTCGSSSREVYSTSTTIYIPCFVIMAVSIFICLGFPVYFCYKDYTD